MTFITNKPIDSITTTTGSEFGKRVPPTKGASEQHKGLDFSIPIGTNVYAAHPAQVIYKAYNAGWGNFIVLKDTVTGGATLYAHFSSYAQIRGSDGNQKEIAVGDIINGGTKIGLSGNSGVSSGAHLHFEVFDSTAADGLKNKQTGIYRSPIPKDIRQNPREHLAEAFPKEFSTVVNSGIYGMDVTGDERENRLIGNSRSNILKGEGGLDTYELSLAGEDQIIDSDNSGILKIKKSSKAKTFTTLEGNADPVKNKNGEIVEGKYTLGGYDLTLTEPNADGKQSLIITTPGANLGDPNTAKIIIKDLFPSAVAKPFNIELGKSKEVASYSRRSIEPTGSVFTTLESQIIPTPDERGRFISPVWILERDAFNNPVYPSPTSAGVGGLE